MIMLTNNVLVFAGRDDINGKLYRFINFDNITDYNLTYSLYSEIMSKLFTSSKNIIDELDEQLMNVL